MPVVMAKGLLSVVTMKFRLMLQFSVIRPIPPPASANHTLPSGPAVIATAA